MIYDVIIIGQGLAGTALAWSLLGRSAKVAIVQAQEGGSASQVAAGLVTPVTGRKLREAPDFQRDKALAASAYRAAEQTLGTQLWFEQPALRLIQSPQGTRDFELRREALMTSLQLARPAPDAGFAPYSTALLMPDAARLDVARYVDTSREHFVSLGCLRRARVVPGDLQVDADMVRVARTDLCGRRVVWCGGQEDADNAWLEGHALSPAKGEILTVAIDNFHEKRTAHSAGHWLLPTASTGVYRFGATYDHDDLTPETTAAARVKLTERLAQIIDRPFSVVDQQAGIRPVGQNRRPFIGTHPVHRRVCVFNGLGSRGVLWAPRLADKLAQALLGDEVITL